MSTGVHIPNYENMYLPNAEDFCAKEITIPHQVLLAGKEGVDLIVRSIVKIKENLHELS